MIGIEINIVNVLAATIAVINTLYGLIVFSRNRENTTNQSFFFLTLVVSTWGLSILFLRSAETVEVATWAARALYATAALIPFASVYFASLFPTEKKKLSFYQKMVVPIPLIFILALTILPQNGLIDTVVLNTTGEPRIIFDFIQHTLYSIFIIGYFSWVYVILFKKFFVASGILKIQLAYILIGTLTTTGIAVFTNLLLPYFGIFAFNWVGQIGILAMITFILYSVLKHHLFSINIIATELFVVVLQLTLFTQIFVADSLQDRLLSAGIFGATFIIGIILIRSVIREVEARQQIEKLAKDLRSANEKLKELDKLKSQFLSIASHDLRAPLTAIRNFMSLLMDGTYGKLPPAAEEGVQHVFDRATAMATSVDDYLNVSRIEQGELKYDLEAADLKEVVMDTLGTFKPSVQEKGLKLNIVIPEHETFPAMLDKVKIQEVFNNLLDNAIKYTPEGTISIMLEKIGNTIRYTQQDTGVGMDEKTQKNLFGLFAPGEDSKKINPKSTGVGLYITKAHVEGHKGTVRAESAGKGKGSTFVVELPLKR